MSKPTLTEQDFINAAAAIGCEVNAIKAVCQVEAPNGGFLPDGQCTILFERHKFYQFTSGKYFHSHPDICNPKAGGYGAAGQPQHDRLAIAVSLDRQAALKSASYGKFQICGFNYLLAGFDTVQKFITAMFTSEGEQLKAFVNFIKASKLDDELRSKKWADFARGYNGKNFAINAYDVKMKKAYEKLNKK